MTFFGVVFRGFEAFSMVLGRFLRENVALRDVLGADAAG